MADSEDAPVVDLLSVQFSVAEKNCADLSAPATGAIGQNVSGGSGLINKGAGNYQYNWKVPKGTTGCKVVELSLPDEYPVAAGPLQAYFRFRK